MTATDLNACSKGIQITWLDASNWHDSGFGTRSYEIYRNGSLLVTRPYGTNSYTDSATAAGTTYDYVVRYLSGVGLYSDSGPVSASDSFGVAPSSLTNNTAADVSLCADSGVTVTWPANPGDWGDNAIGTRTYSVLRDGSVIAASVAYNTTTYTDTTGTNGTSYSYQVRYNNGCGLNGTTTGVSAADAVPSAPSSLTNNTAADASVCEDSGVRISWAADPGNWGDNGSGTRSYSILRNGAVIVVYVAYPSTSYIDNTGASGTSYAYSVRYNNGCYLDATTTGASAADIMSSVPSSLTNNTAADVSACADSGVSITWAADPGDWGDNGSGTRTYTVIRNSTVIATSLAYGTTTHTDSGGTNGMSFTYRVQYNNGCGSSFPTDGASAMDFVSTAPTASNNTAADVSACADSGVLVSWSSPSNWNDNGSGTRTIDVLRGGTAIATGLAATATSHTDSGGNNGQSYTYTVRFNNGCGLNATTAGASAADQLGAAPSSLTNNTAADVSGCADSGVLVSWAAPGNWGDNGSGIRTIDVLRGATPIATGLAATATSHTDTGGNNGQSYTYTVRFNNGCGLNATTAGASATDQLGAAPSSLTNNTAADVSACADSGVLVSWAAPGDWGDNGSGTRTINVLRGGAPIGPALAATATTYTDTTGNNGQSYTYAVRFYNGCNLIATTAGASAADLLGAAPSSLANNTAADVSSCADSGVTVTWAADPGSWGDNGAGTRTYSVLRNGAALVSGGCSGSKAYGTTTCTDATGTNYTTYTYTVRYNNGCALDATTTGASAGDYVTKAPDLTGNNAVADLSACADTGVLVTWSAPSFWNDNGTGTRAIDVLRGGTAIATGLAWTDLSYTDTTGTNGTSYNYQVRFKNGCGLSATTAGASAMDFVGTAPTASNNAAADLSACADTGVLVSWSAPSNWNDSGTGERTIDVLRGGVYIATGLASTATSFTDTTGANGTSYSYQVRFKNTCGLTTLTAGASAGDAVDATPCSRVGDNLTVAKSGGDAALSWTAVACGDLTNYRLYGATTYGATFPSGWTLLGSPTGTTSTDALGSSYVAYAVVTVDACGNVSTN